VIRSPRRYAQQEPVGKFDPARTAHSELAFTIIQAAGGSDPMPTADVMVALLSSQVPMLPLAEWYQRMSDLRSPLKSPVCASVQPAAIVPTPCAEATCPLAFMNQIPTPLPVTESRMSLMPSPSKSPVPAMLQVPTGSVPSPLADLIVPLLFSSHTATAPLVWYQRMSPMPSPSKSPVPAMVHWMASEPTPSAPSTSPFLFI